MATVAVTSSPVTLDSGSSEFVTVTNTGTVDVTVARGSQSFALRPTQGRVVYPEGSAVTASVVSGSGQVTTSAQAAQVTQAQQVTANTAAIAGLPGTYVQIPAGGSDGQAVVKSGSGFAWQSFPGTTAVASLTTPGSVVVLDDGTTARYDGTRAIYPLTEIVFWGHSLFANSSGAFPSRVGTLTGATVVNNGIGGQTSTDIAIRKGGIVPLLTLSGGSIPADTSSVAVTATIPAGDFRGPNTGSSTFTYTGALAGIAGTLTETVAAGGTSWSFARTSGGSVTAVPANTPFLVSNDTKLTSTSVFLVARNNFYTANGTLRYSIRDLQAMVATLTPLNPRYVVLSEMNAITERIGSVSSAATRRAAILAENASRAAQWPTFYYDIRSDFIALGLAMAGVTPTVTDQSDVAADAPPTQLMADDIHPTAAGFSVMGSLLTKWLVGKGWYTYSGNTPPGAPTALAATAGAGTASLIWTAPASTGGSAITAYVVQYKRAVDTAWSTVITTSAPSTATSATVTGLLGSTAYNFRVVAINAQGPSDWSATATATTTAVADSTAPTAPTTITATPGAASVSVAFSGATDNVGVTQYRVYSDADSYVSSVATGTVSPIVVTGLTNGVKRFFKVSAGDAAGNWSPLSAASNAAVPASTAVVVSDSFTRADASLNGSSADLAYGGSAATWTASNARVVVVSGQVGKNAATGFDTSSLTAGTDGRIDLTVAAVGTGNLNIWGRRADASNSYYLQVQSSGALNLAKLVAGVNTTTLANFGAGTVTAGTKLGLRVVADTLQVFINGALRSTVVDTSLATGSLWGFEIAADSTVRIDDVVISAG